MGRATAGACRNWMPFYGPRPLNLTCDMGHFLGLTYDMGHLINLTHDMGIYFNLTGDMATLAKSAVGHFMKLTCDMGTYREKQRKELRHNLMVKCQHDQFLHKQVSVHSQRA